MRSLVQQKPEAETSILNHLEQSNIKVGQTKTLAACLEGLASTLGGLNPCALQSSGLMLPLVFHHHKELARMAAWSGLGCRRVRLLWSHKTLTGLRATQLLALAELESLA